MGPIERRGKPYLGGPRLRSPHGPRPARRSRGRRFVAILAQSGATDSMNPAVTVARACTFQPLPGSLPKRDGTSDAIKRTGFARIPTHSHAGISRP